MVCRKHVAKDSHHLFSRIQQAELTLAKLLQDKMHVKRFATPGTVIFQGSSVRFVRRSYGTPAPKPAMQ
jgi:hypothetical protein